MHQVRIEIPEDKWKELEQLMNECGLRTKKALVNNALTLLKWAVSERKKGNTVGSIDDKRKKYRVLQMTVLDKIKIKRG